MKYLDSEDEEIVEFNIEDFQDKNFLEWEDGTTAFNVYCMGQNIVHDLWADGVFANDDVIVSEKEMMDWVLNSFKNILQEVMDEVKYQLQFNPDINQGNIYVEDIIE